MFPPPPSLTRRLSFFYFCLYFFIERESTYDVRCLVCTVQGMYVLIRMKWYSIGKTYVLLEYRYSIQYTSISHTVLVSTYTGTPSLKFRCTAVPVGVVIHCSTTHYGTLLWSSVIAETPLYQVQYVTACRSTVLNNTAVW